MIRTSYFMQTQVFKKLEDITDFLDYIKGEPGTPLYIECMTAIGQIQSGMSSVMKAKAIVEKLEAEGKPWKHWKS